MNSYTFHQDAADLVSRITTAPDFVSKMNLLDELRDKHLSLATSTQMLAESNDRWARENNGLKANIAAHLEALLNNDAELVEDDDFKAIAELVDFSLDTEFEVTIKLHYVLSITAPRGTSEDAIREAIEWREAKFNLNTDDFEKTSYNDGHEDYEISVSEQQ
jgi:FtsZ-binding cell division protein ZapB